MRAGARPSLRAAALVAAAGAVALVARPADAHLMAARQGTVNVVGDAVFMVLSLPASALHDADDDHDGVLDAAELERHEAALRAEIDRRFVVLDGATAARTVRIDLMLSPAHGAPGGKADQIVALKHAVLDAPPADLRVRCDLFGATAADRAITLTATRHPASGTETQVEVFTPGEAEHAFFRPAPSAPLPEGKGGLEALLAAAAVVALAAAAVRPWARAPRVAAP